MRVAIGADHAGRILQDRVAEAVTEAGAEPIVVTPEPDPAFEYPDIAQRVGMLLRDGAAERAILICGSGAGMAVAANKLRGLRAATAHDTYTAHQMVEHDDVNVLTLGSRVVGAEVASEIVCAFVRAAFNGSERHVRRVTKVVLLERNGR